MYKPNSIQSRLNIKEDDSNILLQEVNDTLESLQQWKDEEKKKDEDLELKLSQQKQSLKPELEESSAPGIEINDFVQKDLKCEQAELIQIHKVTPQALYTLPEVKTVNNFELYKAGDELNQMLNNWNSSLDFLAPTSKPQAKSTEEWEQIDEIEKELQELEDLMDSVPNYH